MGFNPGPLIIGHRGAAGLQPENTLASFAAAYAQGVQAVELDVYQVEGQLLVIHDDLLDRTTNGQGLVQQASLAYLRSLDAGGGQQIPLLSEVLEQVPRGVGVNVELKGADTAATVAQVLAGYPHVQVLVSSFRHSELVRYRGLDAQRPLAPLFHQWPPAPWRIAAKLDAWSINLHAPLATAKRVEKIHRLGYRCMAYTVNDPVLAKTLLDRGVDGLFTDRPDLVKLGR